ncbi:MAG TPA: hypothetical protein VJA47_04275 [archaeon]|nr:hypothetical protein [archaeon]
MPTVNIYTRNRSTIDQLNKILLKLKEFIAKELSCGDRKLASDEISIRILVPESSSQIADTELEIKVHSYKERVQRQDDICLSIKEYVQKVYPKAGSVYVWLQLSELGHSLRE